VVSCRKVDVFVVAYIAGSNVLILASLLITYRMELESDGGEFGYHFRHGSRATVAPVAGQSRFIGQVMRAIGHIRGSNGQGEGAT